MEIDNLIEHIPQPDESGSVGTQTERQGEVLTAPESPMSMGQTATGLAAESHSGFNRQTTQIMVASWRDEREKREEAEGEVKKLLPENAVLKERVKNLRRDEKKGAYINLIGLALFTIGTTILLADTSVKNPSYNTVGWLILGLAAVLFLIDVLNSLLGKD